MEDNVLGKGAATSGKLMVYGSGAIKEKFLKEGKFLIDDHFLSFQISDFF